MSGDLRLRVFERHDLAWLDPAERRLELRRLALEAGAEDPASAIAELADLTDGFGRLSPLMRADDVTDVLVNGPGEVWVERDGRLERSGITFEDEGALRELIEVLAGRAGARVDASRPLADARLPDGSRMHVVLPPVAPNGPLVSIRRFHTRRHTLAELGEGGMFEPDTEACLRAAVIERRNVVVGGATGSGKTTLLNALLSEVPATERVVIVEETPELRPACPHAVALAARGSNVEGRGEIGLDALARAALRMRPDRIVVGEVRGTEAAVALDAMATGHEGSMLTVHGRSGAGALARLAALVARGDRSLTRSEALDEVRGAIDVVVHLERRHGRRVVAEVLEP